MKRMILKFWLENGKTAKKIYKASGRRFISKVVPNLFLKGYVFVSYGKKLCNLNCMCEFYNDAEATTKPTLLKLIRDFLEEE